MSPADDSNTLARLRERLKTARAEYDLASENFRNVIAQLPSGLSATDGVLNIAQSGTESRNALRRYMDALDAFHNFEVYGIAAASDSAE